MRIDAVARPGSDDRPGRRGLRRHHDLVRTGGRAPRRAPGRRKHRRSRPPRPGRPRRRRSRRIRPRPSSPASRLARTSSSGRSSCHRPSTSTSRTPSTASSDLSSVTVEWEDHRGVPGRPGELVQRAGNAPDVINLSVGEGWVSDYASRGLLLGLNDKVPQEVQDIYFDGLWDSQLVDGQSFQFPWYQAHQRRAHQQADLRGGRRPERRRLPDDRRWPAGAVRDDQGEDRHPLHHPPHGQRPALADGLRGGVDVFKDDGTFAFDSPEGVAWLQMYVDMVKAETVDNSVLMTGEIASACSCSPRASRRSTRPARTSSVRSSRTTRPCTTTSRRPVPVGKSGVSARAS